jgi:hypothetical protein
MTDTYEEPKIIAFSNMVVRIYRPILTPDEKEKRMKSIRNAAARLLKNT